MTPGQKLSAGDIVFTIANDTTVWANLTVHARDLPAIRTGTPATIQSSFRDGATTGQIALILPHIDEDTRTATARVVLDNPDGRWQPGMFVTARLELPPETAAIAVPKAAVQTVEGEAVVFIPHGGEFETQVVQTGRSDRDQIEIIAGLRPGDAFVAAGAFELKARMLTSNLDPHAGHGH
jgi:cobalt-zinc-cadmium efflux system membrane fusion protein